MGRRQTKKLEIVGFAKDAECRTISIDCLEPLASLFQVLKTPLRGQCLECESHLKFDPPIVGRFRKRSAGLRRGACGLICLSKERGSDISDNRAGIVMVRHIPNLHGENHPVARLHLSRLPRGIEGRFGGTKGRCLAHAQIQLGRARSPSRVTDKDCLIGSGIRVQQAVRGLNEAWLVWIRSDSGSAVEERCSVQVTPNRDVKRRPEVTVSSGLNVVFHLD
jgi:hypothetical protein